MNHLAVLQEKVVSLRAEIAQIHELNQQYRQRKGNATAEQVAHGQRHERLQEIQKELGRLAALGRSVVSISEVREQNRSRLQLIKKSRVS
jgi:DNA-binding transcriptional regulator YbjK